MAVNQQSLATMPRASELKWLNDHFKELDNYVGQWVVIEGSRLVAADADYETVSNRASDAGIARPFIIFIPPHEENAFMGL